MGSISNRLGRSIDKWNRLTIAIYLAVMGFIITATIAALALTAMTNSNWRPVPVALITATLTVVTVWQGMVRKQRDAHRKIVPISSFATGACWALLFLSGSPTVHDAWPSLGIYFFYTGLIPGILSLLITVALVGVEKRGSKVQNLRGNDRLATWLIERHLRHVYISASASVTTFFLSMTMSSAIYKITNPEATAPQGAEYWQELAIASAQALLAIYLGFVVRRVLWTSQFDMEFVIPALLAGGLGFLVSAGFAPGPIYESALIEIGGAVIFSGMVAVASQMPRLISENMEEESYPFPNTYR